MLLIEKVLILRSSEIFQNTPETELVDIAGILEEVYINTNATLFSKGDIGNCMYFIFKGKVSIHDGAHTLAVLGENEIVGELSVLDAENRSASATTLALLVSHAVSKWPIWSRRQYGQGRRNPPGSASPSCARRSALLSFC